MKSHKLAKTFRLGLKQTGLDKKIRKASTAQLLSMFVRRCSRQCSHTVVIFFSNPKAPPDPPGSTGSTRIHLVDPRIHLPNLTFIDVWSLWATFNYIILILHTPPKSFRILWGAGGVASRPGAGKRLVWRCWNINMFEGCVLSFEV